MENLAYYKVNYVNPIYLEYAPKGFIGDKPKKVRRESESKTLADDDEDQVEEDTKRKQQR